MSIFGFEPSIPQGLKDVGNQISATASEAYNNLKSIDPAKILDPAGIRLQMSDLMSGGVAKKSPGAVTAPRFSSDLIDWRVRIKLAKGADYFYNDPTNAGILGPLKETDGVIFPYTPQISITHTARYGAQNLTHSNYTNYAYEGSEVAAINITGDFTAQNGTEAAYVLACIHFFRSATKMWFGGSTNTGSPPPMVFLTGYGDNYFPNVPCVVTSFSHTMPQDVDYVQMSNLTFSPGAPPKPTVGGGKPGESNMAQAAASPTTTVVGKANYTMVPTSSQIQITLQPIYSRRNIADNFNLSDFARGSLISGNGGKTTGFI
jgi:hypothetical protein